MQRKVKISILCYLLLFVSASLTPTNDEASVLSSEDYNFAEETRNQGPTLSSAINDKNPWESFSQWMCFSPKTIKFTCSKIMYPDENFKMIPGVIAQTDQHRFEFDLSPRTELNCQKTVKSWKTLFLDSNSLCIFAAYLQPIDGNASFWYFSRIKSERVYWQETSPN